MNSFSLKEKTQGFSLKDKCVAVVGCGGLGTNAAVHLAGMGVGKIILCDSDTVGESNLNRQFLFTCEDIGKEKCEVLKKRLSAFAPEVEIMTVKSKITKENSFLFLGGSDAVICAVDNREGRLTLQELSYERGIPVSYGAIEGFFGTAYLLIPDKTPCCECAAIAEKTEIGYSVSSSAGIIGSMQASLAAEYLLTGDTLLGGKLFIYDSANWQTLNVTARKKCKICNFAEVIK